MLRLGGYWLVPTKGRPKRTLIGGASVGQPALAEAGQVTITKDGLKVNV